MIDQHAEPARVLDQILVGRRSIRRFRADRRPDRAAIEALLAAAITAPSASNKQPWRFLVVRDPQVRQDMAAAVRAAVARVAAAVEPAYEDSFRAYGDYFTRFEDAPVVIAALARASPLLSNMTASGSLQPEDRRAIAAMEERSAWVSVGLAIENLLLAAHAAGLGASGMTGPLIAEGALKEILGVRASWCIAALIPVGYPDEAPAPTRRKPLDKVARWIDPREAP